MQAVSYNNIGKNYIFLIKDIHTDMSAKIADKAQSVVKSVLDFG